MLGVVGATVRKFFEVERKAAFRRDGLEQSQSDRIRELIEMVESSEDVGELQFEDEGVRITVRLTSSSVGPLATKSAMISSSRRDTAAASWPGFTSTVTSKMLMR